MHRVSVLQRFENFIFLTTLSTWVCWWNPHFKDLESEVQKKKVEKLLSGQLWAVESTPQLPHVETAAGRPHCLAATHQGQRLAEYYLDMKKNRINWRMKEAKDLKSEIPDSWLRMAVASCPNDQEKTFTNCPAGVTRVNHTLS